MPLTTARSVAFRIRLASATAVVLALALAAGPRAISAAPSIGGVMAHSPDDISGFTSLTGDNNTANVSLPFTFTVEGTNYTSIALSTNGWIEFGGNTAGDSDPTNDCLPTSAHTNPLLAAYWDDLNPFGTSIRYGTVGSSPNRVFIADYEVDLTSGTEGSDDLRFQVQLHERSNLITVRYRDSQNNANGQAATIGFQGAGGASAATVEPLVCNGKILDDNRPDEGWSADVGNAGQVAIAATVQHSPDDITGFTTLSGNDAIATPTMPFSVVIDGTSYSTVAISTNGWIEFGGNTAGDSDPSNDCLPTAAHTNPFVAAYWDDMQTQGTNVRYGTVGSSPNRTFIVDYALDIVAEGGSDAIGIQVQIHEGSGLVNLRYRDVGFLANGQNATIGYQGEGGAAAIAYPLTCNGKILDDNDSVREGWSVHPRATLGAAVHGIMAHSPDDITGFTTLSGNDTTATPTMPFSVVIDGGSYNTVAISTNGWLELGGNTAGDSDPTNDCLPTTAHTNPFLAAYWDDVQTQGTNIRYGTVGASPNRTFIVDYVVDVVAQGSADVIGFQVQIHESSNVIGVKYRTQNANANGQAATIGFQGAGGGSATTLAISCNGKVLDDNRDREGWSVALPICGDEIVELGEQCDIGVANGAPSSCCTATCQFRAPGAECRAPADECDLQETCSGSSDACPADIVQGSGAPCTDDGVFCTDDVCDGVGVTCQHPNTSDPCDDLVFCNGADTCSGGSCSIHAGNPCPGHNTGPGCSDSCNEFTDSCTLPDLNGTSCNDGSFCSLTDACSGGACLGTGNPCALGGECAQSCNETADNCFAPPGAPCSDDGMFCNGSESCDGVGACAGSGDPCAGGPECAQGCNEAVDNCLDLPGTPCTDDGLFCTGNETCNGSGTCVSGSDPCSGGPECADTCNEAADNCFETAGTGCTDDGQFCTGTETCDGSGACSGSGDPCTGGPECADTCNETVDNCLDLATTPCIDDGLFCSGSETCNGAGACVSAGDPCTGGPECADACNETLDNCFDAAATVCTDDGLFCTGSETCNGAGACTGGGDPCTGGPECAQSCNDVADDCFDTAGTACTDDGLFCSGSETCNGAGACINGGDPCTGGPECAQSCNDTADNCFDTTGTPCTDDTLFCTGSETCDGSGACTNSGDPCVGGAECNATCNDTADDCFDTAGTPCTDDGLFCTGSEACDGAGICAGSGDPCPGGPECADTCDDAGDTCNLPFGTPCGSDGNVCTDDLCDGAGVCGVDNAVSCDDGNGCTAMDQCGGGSCDGMSIPGCGDHYVAYKIKAPKKDAAGFEIAGNAFPRDWVITVNDTLLNDLDADDPENFVVKKEKSLLVEASKNTEPGPFAPGLRYLRYQMKLGSESVAAADVDGDFAKPPKHVLRRWQLDNQFGSLNVLSKKVTALLVPAAADLMTPPTAPADTTHYTCYQIKPTIEVTDQTPDRGDGTGKFRKDLQAFFQEALFTDCALLDDGVSPSFDGTAVEGTCLLDLRKPVELCNPADKTEVVPPRETVAVIDESTAQAAQSLLCYKVKLASKLSSADAALLAGGAVGSKIDPKQAKHVKRAAKTSDAVRVAVGNQFPAPLQIDTKGQELVCVPTEVVAVAPAL